MKDKVIIALRKFKEKNPWQGTIKERKEKFIWLHNELNAIYNKNVRLEFNIPNNFREWKFSGRSYYEFIDNKIVLKGRLSVITFLHEWGHALGYNQNKSQQFAVSLFKEVFPEKYEKLTNTGGAMIKR